ncbi:hypothetical protein Cs7R123_48270 [Catellatospora sp. TT07R-123]|uniref:DUF6519 domain-containing protein n=1 Tax=Catellatospora sp. TT07R-123 TaxID=2733863 RepID=UPI001B0ED520|nr:DUF6519 domain-containing protein [Catellatospora sp. TT07R-123]GHJ47485.1 hypothetical protein Cs7R123_48270 [Catellatospora sp. TT07R-123]
MATDVARVSFDPGRRYTGVVPQQGRVSLEAEENEQYRIEDEERLAELREIIGPAGTPDDGYKIIEDGGDLVIGPGTMYVGGVRVHSGAKVRYSAQPDWRDSSGDPQFRKPGEAAHEHVVLQLTEYDVTAAEDPVLREVALGGPDGAARRRIVTRVRLLPTRAKACGPALRDDRKAWHVEGLEFDPATMRLNSASRLLVAWDPPPSAPDPCEPTAAGGYLGAENQLIRVQVSAAYEDGTFDLLWGYDNASMLYRVTAGSGTMLTLDRAPVDDYHFPRAGQPVQVLRAAADLDSADGVTEGWAAALCGEVAALSEPYDPDTRTVVLPAPPPAVYLDADATPQLYLRVWEELRTGVKSGQTVALTGTGVSVTIELEHGFAHPGDFWQIGVRPATPDTVLPARLLREAQPPDGPRMWACPLAVVAWSDGRFQLLDDCRIPFPPLTGLTPGTGGGCCTVSVDVADAARLQAIIDQATAGRPVGDPSQQVTVCLRAGRYQLAEPLVLTAGHGRLHLEGCGGAVVLAVAPGREDAFPQGMIVAVGVEAVTVTGITFELPPAYGLTDGSADDFRLADDRISAVHRGRGAAIAVRSVNTRDLRIADCTFDFDIGYDPDQRGVGQLRLWSAELDTAAVVVDRPPMVAVGILIGGACVGLTVEGCRFVHDRARASDVDAQVMVGVMVSPSLVRTAAGRRKVASGMLVDSLLDDARLRDNLFAGITVAVAALGEVGGVLIGENTVRDCYGGFWLLSAETLRGLDLIDAYRATDVSAATMTAINTTVQSVFLDPVAQFLVAFGWTYPLPDSAGTAGNVAGEAGPDPAVWTKRFVDSVAGGPSAPSVAFAEIKAETWFGRAAVSRDKLIADAGSSRDLRAAALTAIDFARSYAIQVLRHETRLQIHHNTVDCATTARQYAVSDAVYTAHAATGPAVIVLNRLGAETAASRAGHVRRDGVVQFDANQCTARCDGAVVTLALVGTTTVTGNTVRRAESGYSLAVLGATEGAAITGNVLWGPAVLPAGRPFPAPLDNWLPFNTVR